MLDKIVFCGLIPIMLVMAFLDGGYQSCVKAIKEIKRTWRKI